MIDTVRSPFVTESSIQLPFSITGSGSVAATSSQEKIWEYRVKLALGTAIGERLLRADYGVDITELEFNTSSVAEQIVQREIESVFAKYLPDLNLDEIDADFDYSNGLLNVTVSYYLPSSDLSTTTIGIATISGDSPISEV